MTGLDAFAYGVLIASVSLLALVIGAGVQDWYQRRRLRRFEDELRELRDRVARLEGRADRHTATR